MASPMTVVALGLSAALSLGPWWGPQDNNRPWDNQPAPVTTTAAPAPAPAAPAPAPAPAQPAPNNTATSETSVPPPAGGGGHVINFVNHSGRQIWIGSRANGDGSASATGLPSLPDGGTAQVTVPEGAGHWSGTYFAREDCGGTSGSDFHCAIGDCGVSAGQCDTGQQPVSLAEFTFNGSAVPYYDVSYVDAVSLPITIHPDNGAPADPAAECIDLGCSGPLLDACPAGALQYPAGASHGICVNPSRDAPSDYSNAIRGRCPNAYAWSKQDTEPGNVTTRTCPSCSSFTVTFNAA